MSYTINLTSGAKLTDIIDGSVDQTATDLTLIGRNVSNYGTFLNDNFVYLLENFANVTEPSRPITGQLWYDTNAKVLKIYNGSNFAPTGNTVVSNTQPDGLASGSLWIDSLTKQLKFYDGVDLMTAGPIYTNEQGVSGFVVTDVIDTFNQNHIVVELRVADSLVGIFSKDSFTPLNPIAEFTGSIVPGFNVGSNADLTFDMTVTTALNLVDSDSNVLTADSFLLSTGDDTTSGSLSIINNVPLKLGEAGELWVQIDSGLSQLYSNKVGQNFQITTRRLTATYDPAVFISTPEQFVGVYTDAPTHTLDVNGDTRIRGNLLVEGTTTTINSTNLSIEDLMIELGKVATPTDNTANGGGILLAGDTSKTILWNLARDAWVSSENFDLNGGSSYRIGGNIVLTNTSLGTSVATASGLTSIGHLTQLDVSWLNLSNGTISFTYDIPGGNGDISLVPKGAGTVNVNNAKISNLGAPADATDAATVQYVDDTVASAPIGIAINIGSTLMTDNTGIVTTYLEKIFPPSEYLEGTILRAYCTNTIPDTPAFKRFLKTGSTWVHDTDY